MKISYAEKSDIGLKPLENQDAVFCSHEDDRGLFVIADGMGGHDGGAYASSTITGMLECWWNEKAEATIAVNDSENQIDSIRKVIHKANDSIRDSISDNSVCGSTVLTLWIDGKSYALFSCGDSRCYRVRRHFMNTEIECITSDDVWENNPDNITNMTEEEIHRHRNYGKLVRAVGTEKNFACTLRCDELSEDTLFILCSDGLYKYANTYKLNKIFGKAAIRGANLDSCADECIRLAYASGAPDNISVIFVKITV